MQRGGGSKDTWVLSEGPVSQLSLLRPLTAPSPGTPRLVGADASHAWLSVWLGDTGWVDVDPTNDQLPSDQHVTLG
jgi:transglutaminase-like putative cysteine protease